MKIFRRVKKVNLVTITTDEPIEDVPCGSCTACCEILAPHLSPEEISSGFYPITLSNIDGNPVITLFRKTTGGCGMFVNGSCSIYEDRPIACRQFDCRKGHHSKTNKVSIEKFQIDPQNINNEVYLYESDDTEFDKWDKIMDHYRNQRLDEYILLACDFIRNTKIRNEQFKFVYDDIYRIYNDNKLSESKKKLIENSLRAASYNWAHGNE